MVPSGSILIALAGQGKTRGMVARMRLEACTNQSLCAIVPIQEINSDYLYFYMRTQYQNYRSMSSGEGGRGGLNLQIIKLIEIPVPSSGHQSEIVRILEKLEEYSQGAISNLREEISARRQQYEYYRSKLLTFKELDVA
jgi:type I restriction enzyme S subunit